MCEVECDGESEGMCIVSVMGRVRVTCVRLSVMGRVKGRCVMCDGSVCYVTVLCCMSPCIGERPLMGRGCSLLTCGYVCRWVV